MVWQRHRHCFALALLTSLNGCTDAFENATVTISYEAVIGSQDFGLLQTAEKKRIEETFQEIVARHGYRCQFNIKRVEQISCRGPNDLHLEFRPALNKAEYVATFSWANVAGRTHEEFTEHVLTFKREFDVELGEHRVFFKEEP